MVYPSFGEKCNNNVTIFLSEVPQKMTGIGHFAVGYILWSSSIILSKWLLERYDMIRGKCVLELGAGLGLCGIVASSFASSVLMTDYNEAVIDCLKYNISINRSGEICDTMLINGMEGVIPMDCVVEVNTNNYPFVLFSNNFY
jgi:predicted nicotinamide N-methyase